MQPEIWSQGYPVSEGTLRWRGCTLDFSIIHDRRVILVTMIRTATEDRQKGHASITIHHFMRWVQDYHKGWLVEIGTSTPEGSHYTTPIFVKKSILMNVRLSYRKPAVGHSTPIGFDPGARLTENTLPVTPSHERMFDCFGDSIVNCRRYGAKFRRVIHLVGEEKAFAMLN